MLAEAKTAITFKLIGKKADNYSGSGYGEHILQANGVAIAWYQAWAFSCCGCGAFSGFAKAGYTYPNWWTVPENVHAFVEWLKAGGTKPSDGWNPQEFLFVLTPAQMTQYKPLVTHPLVRRVDGWSNKSHDGTQLSLYRLSLQKDFPNG